MAATLILTRNSRWGWGKKGGGGLYSIPYVARARGSVYILSAAFGWAF